MNNGEESMGTEDNKALVRRVYDAINDRSPDELDELIATDVASNTPFAHDAPGLEGFKQVFAAVIAAFPDYRIAIEDQIAEGDEVVTRYTASGTQEGEFMGVAASGRRVELVGIDIDRLADGRIVEHWSEAGVERLGAKHGLASPR